MRATRLGAPRLFPLDGGDPKQINGVGLTERVVGASPNTDVVYVSLDPLAIPQKIVKVNTLTGNRQPFVTVAPDDPAGILALFPPIFTRDEKQYVETQLRQFSSLFIGTGLK